MSLPLIGICLIIFLVVLLKYIRPIVVENMSPDEVAAASAADQALKAKLDGLNNDILDNQQTLYSNAGRYLSDLSRTNVELANERNSVPRHTEADLRKAVELARASCSVASTNEYTLQSTPNASNVSIPSTIPVNTVQPVSDNDQVTSTVPWQKMAGQLTSVSAYTDREFYGVNAAGEPFVSFDGGKSYRSLKGNAPALKQISADGTRACGVTSKGDIYCTDNTRDMKPSWRKVAGSAKQISVSGNYSCMVANNGTKYCNFFGKDKWYRKPDKWKHTTLKKGRTCSVKSNGTVYCSNDPFQDYPKYEPPVGTNFDTIDFDSNSDRMCGMQNGVMMCKAHKNANWVTMGTGSDISVANNTAYAVNAKHDVLKHQF